MTPCPRERDIQLLHDGELPEPQRRELESHLASCPVCAEEFAGLQRFSRKFQSLPIEPMPVQVEHRAKAVWAQRQHREIERLVAWFSAAAAVLLVGSLIHWPANVEEIAIVTGTNAPSSWELAAITPGDALERESDTMRFALWMNAGLSGNANLDAGVPTTQTR